MIKRITHLNQVIDSLDNERVTFYSGKNKDKDETSREVIRKMKPEEVNKLIKEGLIIKVSRY